MGVFNKLSMRQRFPRLIPNLKAWYAADMIFGLNNAALPSDGAAISSITDCSGNGLTLTQGTGANQPTYKTGIINGRPVFRFGGTHSIFRSNVSSFRNVTGGTVFIVANNTNDTGTQILFIATINGSGSTRFSAQTSGTSYRLSVRRLDADSTGTLDAGTVATSTFRLQTSKMDWSTGAGTIYINGSQIGTNGSLTTTGNTSDTNSQSMSIGASAGAGSGFNGDIAEVIMYESALSDTNRAAIEEYLNKKYLIY